MTASWQISPRAHSIATSGTGAGASKAGAVYSIAVSTRVSAISMAIQSSDRRTKTSTAMPAKPSMVTVSRMVR